MTAYRTIVKIYDGINHEEYLDSRIFLFEPFKCAYQHELDFVNKCKLLFRATYVTQEDAMDVVCEYKTYEIHPLRDFVYRIGYYIKHIV